MNNLDVALNAKFAATSALTTLFTGNTLASGSVGLHWDTATKGVGPPYLVAQVLSAPSQSKYGGVTLTDVTVQFKALAVGRDAALAGLQAVITAFDEFVPTLATGRCSGMQRIMDPLPLKIPAEEASGADEWQAITQYVYSIEP